LEAGKGMAKATIRRDLKIFRQIPTCWTLFL
jgi:hypothetical protein